MTLDSVISDCIEGIREHAKKPYVNGETQVGPTIKRRNQRTVNVRQAGGAYRVLVIKIPVSEFGR